MLLTLVGLLLGICSPVSHPPLLPNFSRPSCGLGPVVLSSGGTVESPGGGLKLYRFLEVPISGRPGHWWVCFKASKEQPDLRTKVCSLLPSQPSLALSAVASQNMAAGNLSQPSLKIFPLPANRLRRRCSSCQGVTLSCLWVPPLPARFSTWAHEPSFYLH